MHAHKQVARTTRKGKRNLHDLSINFSCLWCCLWVWLAIYCTAQTGLIFGSSNIVCEEITILRVIISFAFRNSPWKSRLRTEKESLRKFQPEPELLILTQIISSTVQRSNLFNVFWLSFDYLKNRAALHVLTSNFSTSDQHSHHVPHDSG